MSWLSGDKIYIEIGHGRIKDQVKKKIGGLWDQQVTLNNVLVSYFVIGMQERLFSQRMGTNLVLDDWRRP